MLSDWAHAHGSSVVQCEQHEYDVKKKHCEPQSCPPKYLCRILKWGQWSETYSEPCQTSKVECFAKIVNGFYMLTVFTIGSILDIWQGSEYEFDCNCKDFVVYLSIILFPNITMDTVLIRRRPLRCTFQWLRLPEISYRLSLTGKNIIGESNNIFLFLIKLSQFFPSIIH